MSKIDDTLELAARVSALLFDAGPRRLAALINSIAAANADHAAPSPDQATAWKHVADAYAAAYSTLPIDEPTRYPFLRACYCGTNPGIRPHVWDSRDNMASRVPAGEDIYSLPAATCQWHKSKE